MSHGFATAGPRFEEIRPEPACFWIRWAPRGWPGPQTDFLDLARGRLAPAALRRGEAPAALPTPPPDTLYLPPVRSQAEEERAAWLRRATAGGWPVLLQVSAGESPPEDAAAVVFDLTAALFDGDLSRLDQLPVGSAAVWPLVAGVSDGPAVLREGCERLRGAGVAHLQAVVPALSPGERRRLSEAGGDRAYHALFHGPPPRAGDLARLAVELGIDPLLPRPAFLESGRRSRNRRLAEHLGRTAQWWLLLDRAEGGAQALFRAARWVDTVAHDVEAMASEGNLSVVDWLEPVCRHEIERYAAGEAASAIAELASELVKRSKSAES